MSERYDVAIIGCGEAGIYAGYELMRRNPELKVVVLEQGRDIYSRSCPIVAAGKVRDCIQCKVCDTMCGFGGAGAFSDGKFNFTTAFGGWLTDFMPAREVMDLIEYVDLIDDLGMDSMIFLSVIIELETTFDIIIPDDLLLMENFREIDTIVDIVKKSVNGIGGKEAVVHDEA